MTDRLVEARANRDAIGAALDVPGHEWLTARSYVLASQNADRIGDETDTRILAGALAHGLGLARRRHDNNDVYLYAAQLLAVLSGLADDGDETAAVGVNLSVANLTLELIEMGKACAKERERRH